MGIFIFFTLICFLLMEDEFHPEREVEYVISIHEDYLTSAF